jgi:hypothetical protein
VFVFLAGTGAYFQLARGKSKRDLSKFLLTRGLWLIFLELTVVRFGVFFSADYRFFGFLQVIWVIGVSMIVLAALIHLPVKVTAGFGLAMIFLHNLLDRFQATPWQGPGQPCARCRSQALDAAAPAVHFFPGAGISESDRRRYLQHHSLGWRHGCWIRVWLHLSKGSAEPASLVVLARNSEPPGSSFWFGPWMFTAMRRTGTPKRIYSSLCFRF